MLFFLGAQLLQGRAIAWDDFSFQKSQFYPFFKVFTSLVCGH